MERIQHMLYFSMWKMSSNKEQVPPLTGALNLSESTFQHDYGPSRSYLSLFLHYLKSISMSFTHPS